MTNNLCSRTTKLPGRWLLLAAMLVLGACASGASSDPPGVQVLDADTRRTIAAPPTTMPPLAGPSARHRIASCTDLEQEIRSGAELDELREAPAFAAYLPCMVVALLRTAKGAVALPIALESAGSAIFERLDLSTVRSSLAQRRPADHYAFRDFTWAARDVKPLSLRAATSQFEYTVDVLAAGDFTGEGSGQLLVRFKDKSLTGSYDASTLLVLRAAPAGQRIEAIDALTLLQKRAR